MRSASSFALDIHVAISFTFLSFILVFEEFGIIIQEKVPKVNPKPEQSSVLDFKLKNKEFLAIYAFWREKLYGLREAAYQ